MRESFHEESSVSSRKKDKNSEENVTEAGPKRQYLAFRLADEFFGMELDQTREILEYSDVTDVPLCRILWWV